jgi:hypothetical protein
MSAYESRAELAGKIDWEGGIHEMLFEYGLSDADLPEDDEELRLAAAKVFELLPAFDAAIDAFVALLPEPDDE